MTTPAHLLLPHLITTLLPLPFTLYFTITFTLLRTRLRPTPTPRQTRIHTNLALTSALYTLHLILLITSLILPPLAHSITADIVGEFLTSTATLSRFAALAFLFLALGGETWLVCLPPSWRHPDSFLSHPGISWLLYVLLALMVLLGGLGAFFVHVPVLRAAGEGMTVLAETGVVVGIVGVLAVGLSGLVVSVVRERRRKERIRQSLEGVGMRVNPVAGEAFQPAVTTDIRSGETRPGRGQGHERVVSTVSVETVQTFTSAEEEVEHDEEVRGMDRWLRKRKRHMLLRIGVPAVMLVGVLYLGEAAVGGPKVVTKEGIVREVFGFVGWGLVLGGFRMGAG
ncbi:hypothetical protein BJ508DRAFT_49416 [Ascobolus immersus RN42]|uniref:Uncharacterized protein n=1 Tax=Ascobolus immersus RN42 TaxID=1160509 RepID=A0A3N4HN06_ASCIM|nr:hypothetical protein BJ508DRAFT_49416 [Ascobolus immersus RN42]